MSTIHILPPALINKIAAGEVIERPAFVVKELIENALDAGATEIKVAVTKGGLESITVVDNGEGMSQADLFLAWQSHTTSKLSPESDLTQIGTLGFRGEALASIAAVSELTLQSRLFTEPGGHKLTIKNGKLLDSTVTGMAPGTIVTVEHLFASLPARQKFLGSAQTEWSHMMRHIEAQVLAYPQVRFLVRHNGKLIFDVPAQSLEARLFAVLGSEVAAQSLPFTLEEPYATITGFIGTPQLSFQTNLPSYLIVNHRVIKNKVIAQAIKDSYRGLLKVEATPFFLLYLQVPSETIDVNIHPRKEEIKFLNESALAQTIASQISTTAKKHNLTFRWSTPTGDTESFAATVVRADTLASLHQISAQTPLIQLHNLYIVTQTPEGVMLIDQHAAHERVLYERLSDSYQKLKKSQKSIAFSNPKKLTLPLSQITLLEEHVETLRKLGFTLEPASATSYLIHAVPAFFQDRNVLQLFQELLAELERTSTIKEIDTHSNRMLAFLACRMAIKGGDPLTETAIRQLIRELTETRSSYTCPHGRPTHIALSLSDLEKVFGRK